MKKMKHIIILTIGLWLIGISCSTKPSNVDESITPQENEKIEQTVSLSAEAGDMALKTHCYSCHNPKSQSHDDMLAPPLAGIKYKYSQLYPERAEFISKMSAFVHHPTKENAVMRGPVRRFGLMPPTALDQNEIYQIVAFINDHEVPYPDWFSEHFEEEHGKSWK